MPRLSIIVSVLVELLDLKSNLCVVGIINQRIIKTQQSHNVQLTIPAELHYPLHHHLARAYLQRQILHEHPGQQPVTDSDTILTCESIAVDVDINVGLMMVVGCWYNDGCWYITYRPEQSHCISFRCSIHQVVVRCKQTGCTRQHHYNLDSRIL